MQRHGDAGFLSLVPIGVPAIFLGLHAFINHSGVRFMLLTMIYISLATTHEH